MLVAGITDSYPSREKAGISGSLFSLNFDVEYFVVLYMNLLRVP